MAQPIYFLSIAALVFLYILYSKIKLFLKQRHFKKENHCVPCPHVFNRYPALGLDVLIAQANNTRKHIVLEEGKKRFERLGKTYHSRIIATPVIATRELLNVESILSRNSNAYRISYRETAFGPLLGRGIFNADGERWAHSRQLLRPNFVRGQTSDFNIFERHFSLMLKRIPTDGSTVDLQQLFFQLTLDTTTEFLLNHSAGSLCAVSHEKEENKDVMFSKAVDFAQDDIATSLRLGFLDCFRKKKQGKEAIRICHAYIDKFVDDMLAIEETSSIEQEAQIPDKGRYTFLQELAKHNTDRKTIRDEVINVLIAGRDTTASLMSNMFFEIAKRPDIYAKLRQEISVLEARAPTYKELKTLKYVKYCLNESLRIHPVAPQNSRMAIVDTVLPRGGGSDGLLPLFVPKGTLVSFSLYTMHRCKEIYGNDADEYKPERWEKLRPGWGFLPFGGGPRICLGQEYALNEASYITIRLIQEFQKMESRDPGPWQEKLALTCSSLNGTKVGLTPN